MYMAKAYNAPEMPPEYSSIEINQNAYYMKRVGDTVWLWSNNPNSADNIYHGSDDPKCCSQGFGGSSIKFPLVDGGSITLYGPWHSNSEALKQATGIDLTDKHATFVVIGLGRDFKDSWMGTITDIVYIDDRWVVGGFDRGEKLAKEYANKLNRTVYLHQECANGSSTGPVEPNGE